MAFPETLKRKVREMADMRCCICRHIGVEIHHILPQEDGGPDTIDNAAPLCPNCHDTYGANPVKRKFIRECRDLWLAKVSENAKLVDEFERPLHKKLQSSTDALDFDVKQSISLGDVLRIIFDANRDFTKIPRDEVEAFFDLLFGQAIDETFDAFKEEWVRCFGVEGGKKLCSYFMVRNRIQISEGITEEDVEDCMRSMLGLITLVTGMREVREGDEGFYAFLGERNEFVFSLLRTRLPSKHHE